MANSTLKAIASGETIIAPGVYDMISATIARLASGCFVGFEISASYLGVPDVGIMTFTDMLDRVE